MSARRIQIAGILAFIAGVVGTVVIIPLLAPALRVPWIVVKNVGAHPINILHLELSFLKRDQEHPPTTLEPGEQLKVVLRGEHLSSPSLTITYRLRDELLRFKRGIRTGERPAVTVQIDGREVAVGCRDALGWRAACVFRAEHLNAGE